MSDGKLLISNHLTTLREFIMVNLVLDFDQIVVNNFMSPRDITRFFAQNVLTREMGDIIGNDDDNVFLCDGRIHDNKMANVLVRVMNQIIEIHVQIPGHNMRGFSFTVLSEEATFQRLSRYLDHYINDGRLYL